MESKILKYPNYIYRDIEECSTISIVEYLQKKLDRLQENMKNCPPSELEFFKGYVVGFKQSINDIKIIEGMDFEKNRE